MQLGTRHNDVCCVAACQATTWRNLERERYVFYILCTEPRAPRSVLPLLPATLRGLARLSGGARSSVSRSTLLCLRRRRFGSLGSLSSLGGLGRGHSRGLSLVARRRRCLGSHSDIAWTKRKRKRLHKAVHELLRPIAQRLHADLHANRVKHLEDLRGVGFAGNGLCVRIVGEYILGLAACRNQTHNR